MAFGKSIRIYLKDGTVTGIRFGEVVNHTIQAIACPRIKAGELSQLKEARRPGVYFLFGKDEITNEDMAYVGEAENVFDRLQHHVANKGFWNEVVIFISKDENLTKAHVKYMESRIIQIAYAAKRCKIENTNQPQLPSLPLADRDAMEEFLLQVKMLVGIFGYKALEHIVDFSFKTTPVPELSPASQVIPVNPASSQTDSDSLELFLNVANLKANALQTNEGLVVLAGSEATEHMVDSLSPGYKDFKQQLIESGSLTLLNSKYIFQKEVLFSSPSAAAAMIVGYSVNGRQAWKDKDGRPLKVIEEEKITNQNLINFDEQPPAM